MKRATLATLLTFVLPLLTPACNRGDDDLPPPAPVSGGVAGPKDNLDPSPRSPRTPRPKEAAATPAPDPQGAAPSPQGGAPVPQGGAPSPAQPASTDVPASTPFQIPWFPLPTSLPVSFPTSLPQIPGIPSLPSLPVFPAPSAPQPSGPQPPGGPQPPNAPPPQPSVEPQGTAQVTVYGTKWCGPCKRLQSDLSARGVPYQFVDVEDPKAGQSPAGQRANEIPADMRGSVPVTRVRQRNGQVVWVRGADADRVEKAYRS